jgi:hypothetical protein
MTFECFGLIRRIVAEVLEDKPPPGLTFSPVAPMSRFAI